MRFKKLLNATKRKIIGLIFAGVGGAILFSLVYEWFLKIKETFTTGGLVVVSYYSLSYFYCFLLHLSIIFPPQQLVR